MLCLGAGFSIEVHANFSMTTRSCRDQAPSYASLGNSAQGPSPDPSQSTAPTYHQLSGEEPEEVAKIAEAAESTELAGYLRVLTGSDHVRGCAVNSSRPYLQALQNSLKWPIGGYDTRPNGEGQRLKAEDRMSVLLNYRQANENCYCRARQDASKYNYSYPSPNPLKPIALP